MCAGCERAWSVLHVLWSSVYVTSGAAQLVAGLFFLLALPSLTLACNLFTGIWNIFMGIAAGMVACCGRISPRRQERLLYLVVAILTLNVVNAVVTEWSFYHDDLPEMLRRHQYHTLLLYASHGTRVAAAAVILISFLDSQLTFCSMQTTSCPSSSKASTVAARKKKLRNGGSHEQVSDIEYIIPRSKPKVQLANNAYSQSWVFDSEKHDKHAYLQLEERVSNGTVGGSPTPQPTPKKENVRQNGRLIDNPMVHVEEASDDSGDNTDRQLCHMRTFSRTTSPVVLSAASSQISLAHHHQAEQQQQHHEHSAPIYECLEKLTQPDTFRIRLDSAHSNRDEPQYQVPAALRKEASSPLTEKVQYASLMKELQRAIVGKKDVSLEGSGCGSRAGSKDSSRQDSSTRSDGKSSDTEFSKELEAALQLIQDLESPNVDTPSEPKSDACGGTTRRRGTRSASSTDSEKTLSAVGSLEMTSPTDGVTERAHEGKHAVVIHCDSQSTSGYSSPTHNKRGWSTASSLNGGSNDDLGNSPALGYTIHNTKSTAVISFFPTDTLPKRKNVTRVNITGDFNNLNTHEHVQHLPPQSPIRRIESIKTTTVPPLSSTGWNVKSLLRKKRNASSSQPTTRLCPELEGAIVKSESLAYLTELELLARHHRNETIQRQIEQRVQQQLGTPWIDNE